MIFRTMFGLVIASTLLTACGGGSDSSSSESSRSNNDTKKLSCTSTYSGDLVPSCDTESASLKSGIESLTIVKGTRTKTMDIKCNEGAVVGTSIADYKSGDVRINISGIKTDSCKIFLTAPVTKTINSQQDIDELLDWGNDPDYEDPNMNSNCSKAVLDNSSSEITESMIRACSGSLKIDFKFTDADNKDHLFTLKHTIK